MGGQRLKIGRRAQYAADFTSTGAAQPPTLLLDLRRAQPESARPCAREQHAAAGPCVDERSGLRRGAARLLCAQ